MPNMDGATTILPDFSDAEVKRMAELEHGRRTTELLRDGWCHTKMRDDSRKVHDCLMPWNDLPGHIRYFDRDSVRAFPEILAKPWL